ncbi:hypothetical protein KKH3_20030 [Pectobacterium actinidiae]|nr:hypothetical protein KKH3_20030 [Pectobacterium actinidiae]
MHHNLRFTLKPYRSTLSLDTTFEIAILVVEIAVLILEITLLI